MNEELQEQVDQMSQMLSTVGVLEDASKTENSTPIENITESEDQSSSLVAKTTIIDSYEITVTGVKTLEEGVGNTAHTTVTKPDGSTEKIFVWIYPDYKYKLEYEDLDFLTGARNCMFGTNKVLSLPENLDDGKMAIGLIYQNTRYIA